MFHIRIFHNFHVCVWESLCLAPGASQVALVVKNPPASAGGGLIPGSGRSPGGGHSSPLQYSCMENTMDRGAWWTAVYRVTKSQMWLKWLTLHAYPPPTSFLHPPLATVHFFDSCLLLILGHLYIHLSLIHN